MEGSTHRTQRAMVQSTGALSPIQRCMARIGWTDALAQNNISYFVIPIVAPFRCSACKALATFEPYWMVKSSSDTNSPLCRHFKKSGWHRGATQAAMKKKAASPTSDCTFTWKDTFDPSYETPANDHSHLLAQSTNLSQAVLVNTLKLNPCDNAVGSRCLIAKSSHDNHATTNIAAPCCRRLS